MIVNGCYKIPAHARQFFGSQRVGDWGGVPWGQSSRDDSASFAGLASGGLQWFFPLSANGYAACFVESDCDIDFDGPSEEYTADQLKRLDRYWLPGTTLTWAKERKYRSVESSRFVDSRKFNGVVAPPQLKRNGVCMGDLALVCWGGKVMPAQVYDIGPKAKIGEVSHGLAGMLGIKNNPTTGNDVRDLCTLIFCGSTPGSAVSFADQWELALIQWRKFTGRDSAGQ